jgi:hypothetical protein
LSGFYTPTSKCARSARSAARELDATLVHVSTDYVYLMKLKLTSDEKLFGKTWDRTHHRMRQEELARAHPLMSMPLVDGRER